MKYVGRIIFLILYIPMFAYLLIALPIMFIPYHCFMFVRDGEMRTNDQLAEFIMTPWAHIVDFLYDL